MTVGGTARPTYDPAMAERTPPEPELAQFIDPELRREIGEPMPMAKIASFVYATILGVTLPAAMFWTRSLPGAKTDLRGIAREAGLGLLVGLAVVAATWTCYRAIRPLRELYLEFRKILGDIPLGRIFVLALLSAAAEEVLFRGILQPLLGFWAASVLFGLAHFMPSAKFVSWMVFALGAGLAFGQLYADSGSLIAPFVAHATVNAINLRLIVAGRRR